MHEIGLMQQMVKDALDHAMSVGAHHVQRMTVRVGAESGVVPDVIMMAFEVATRDTIAEGAELQIEHVPVTAARSGTFLETGLEDIPLEAGAARVRVAPGELRTLVLSIGH